VASILDKIDESGTIITFQEDFLPNLYIVVNAMNEVNFTRVV
jgi:hypothetical protein